jgi:hypothetical protein
MLAWVRSIETRIEMGFISLFSADGIHWTRQPGYTIPRLGDRMGCYRDHIRGRYVMNSRQPWHNLRGHLTTKRQIAMAESTDFVAWTEARPIIKLDDDDEIDDQFYGLTPFVWGNQYLGYLELYHRATEHLDLQLVTSRDGEHWTRPARREPFLTRGPDGAWDETWVAFTSNPPIVQNDEMWLYYDGRTGGHQTDRRRGAIGLARARRDRFAGLTAGIQEGEALTERVIVGAPRLLLNLNAHCGEVAVAVYDEEGDPIEGYGRATTARPRQTIRWMRRSPGTARTSNRWKAARCTCGSGSATGRYTPIGSWIRRSLRALPAEDERTALRDYKGHGSGAGEFRGGCRLDAPIQDIVAERGPRGQPKQRCIPAPHLDALEHALNEGRRGLGVET